MKQEILSLESAAKLARYDKAIEWLKNEIKRMQKIIDGSPNHVEFNNMRKMLLQERKEILDILEGKNEK